MDYDITDLDYDITVHIIVNIIYDIVDMISTMISYNYHIYHKPSQAYDIILNIIPMIS